MSYSNWESVCVSVCFCGCQLCGYYRNHLQLCMQWKKWYSSSLSYAAVWILCAKAVISICASHRTVQCNYFSFHSKSITHREEGLLWKYVLWAHTEIFVHLNYKSLQFAYFLKGTTNQCSTSTWVGALAKDRLKDKEIIWLLFGFILCDISVPI